MRRLTAMDVHARKVAELGLDPAAVDLTSIEAIAGALRRTASFLCPCAGATLVRSVVLPLRGLVDDLDTIKVLAEETLEALIAHGDILEHLEFGEDAGRGKGALLYAAPASFVLRRSGAAILLGVASDQLSALPDELEARIEYVNHVRRLSPLPNEDLRSELAQLGLIEISYDGWLKAPSAETLTLGVSYLGGERGGRRWPKERFQSIRKGLLRWSISTPSSRFCTSWWMILTRPACRPSADPGHRPR